MLIKSIPRNSILFFILGIFVFLNIACSSGMRLPDKLKVDPDQIKKVADEKCLNHSVIVASISQDKPADGSTVPPGRDSGRPTGSPSGRPADKDKTAENQPAGSAAVPPAERGEKSLQIDTKQFSDELVKAFRAANVFKSVDKLSNESLSRRNQIKEARDKNAALLMDVHIKKARVYFAGKNDAALGNTALWLLCGIPSFWGADCDYGVDIEAEVSFLDVASDPDFATPAGTYNYPFSEKGSLNYLERSASLAIVIMPPFCCPDSFDRIEKLVSADAQKKFIIQLAETIKKQFQIK